MDERIEVADILLRYEKLDMALEVLEELREEFQNEKDIYFVEYRHVYNGWWGI